MKALVFGGAGYIGSHTVQHLKNHYNMQIVSVDNLSSGSIKAASFSDHFLNADIRDYEAIRKIFREHKPDIVFHFAALLSVPESCDKPYEYFDTNVMGTVNILKSCVEFDVRRFIFSSSVSVYGEGLKGLVTEDSEKKPISHYGLTKKMAEDLIIHHSKVYPEFKYHILRYANVSGAAVDGTNGPHNWNTGQLIHNLCRNAFVDKRVIVYGSKFQTKDGTCIRDYLHVSDLADAHLQAYEKILNSNSSGIWNCSYGRGFTVLEVIRAFEKATGISYEIEYREPRKGDPALIMTSNEKIKAESLWKPRLDNLDEICKTTFSWAQKNADEIIGKLSKSF